MPRPDSSTFFFDCPNLRTIHDAHYARAAVNIDIGNSQTLVRPVLLDNKSSDATFVEVRDMGETLHSGRLSVADGRCKIIIERPAFLGEPVIAATPAYDFSTGQILTGPLSSNFDSFQLLFFPFVEQNGKLPRTHYLRVVPADDLRVTLYSHAGRRWLAQPIGDPSDCEQNYLIYSRL